MSGVEAICLCISDTAVQVEVLELFCLQDMKKFSISAMGLMKMSIMERGPG